MCLFQHVTAKRGLRWVDPRFVLRLTEFFTPNLLSGRFSPNINIGFEEPGPSPWRPFYTEVVSRCLSCVDGPRSSTSAATSIRLLREVERTCESDQTFQVSGGRRWAILFCFPWIPFMQFTFIVLCRFLCLARARHSTETLATWLLSGTQCVDCSFWKCEIHNSKRISIDFCLKMEMEL